MNLEVIVLRTGRYVKPAGQLGTCGWYPRAWQIAVIKRHQTPAQAFLAANPNWRT